MGEHAAARRQQGSAKTTHGLIGCDVFFMHTLSFGDQAQLDLRNGVSNQPFKTTLHAADGPEQVDCGGTGLAQGAANLPESATKLRDIGGLEIARAKGYPHRRRHSNRGSAANDHRPNRFGDLLISPAGYEDLFRWQLRLIDEAHARLGPFQSLYHRLQPSAPAHPILWRPPGTVLATAL